MARANENEVIVTVTGPHGATTAVMHKIAELLLDQTNIPIMFADPKQAIDDRDACDGDWDSGIDLYRPRVLLAEEAE